jgi:magnesium transporter
MQVLTALDPDRIVGLKQRDEFFWLDLTAPRDDDLAQLVDVLRLEPWAARDLEESARLPRFDAFEGYVVMVYFGIGGASRSPYEPVEVRMVISGEYIVTVHDDRCEMLEPLAEHLRARPETPEGIVVYKVLDALTDSFFAALDEVDDRIEALEENVLVRPHRSQLQELVALKNRLVPMRKIATRQRNVLAQAEDRIAELPGLEAGPHDFRDIYQRMISVSELIDSSRDVLTGAQDVYLSSVTERLTLVATIFFPLTVLTGFFGMNFGWMVHHIDSFASFAVFGLGGILALTGAVLVLFRRAGYIGPHGRGYHRET